MNLRPTVPSPDRLYNRTEERLTRVPGQQDSPVTFSSVLFPRDQCESLQRLARQRAVMEDSTCHYNYSLSELLSAMLVFRELAIGYHVSQSHQK